MKFGLFLIAILLISCAGTQYKVTTSKLKDIDDFIEAKQLLANNFSLFTKDSNRNVVNYIPEYLEQAKEIQAKLSTLDSNMIFNSVEESELLVLSMVSNARYYKSSNNEESLNSATQFSPTDSIVNIFLQAIDNHSNNAEKQKSKKILHGENTRTEKTIAEKINFEITKKNISSRKADHTLHGIAVGTHRGMREVHLLGTHVHHCVPEHRFPVHALCCQTKFPSALY